MPDLCPSLATLLPQSGGPYIALVLIGFAVGAAGHLFTSRWLVLTGICLIALGAFVFPVALDLFEGAPPQPQYRR